MKKKHTQKLHPFGNEKKKTKKTWKCWEDKLLSHVRNCSNRNRLKQQQQQQHQQYRLFIWGMDIWTQYYYGILFANKHIKLQ